MNKKDQVKFKKLLLEKRDDLLEIVKNKKERDLTDVEIGDEIDSASQAVEKEMLFELTDNEKVMLDSIESALRRIEKGRFGILLWDKCDVGNVLPFSHILQMPAKTLFSFQIPVGLFLVLSDFKTLLHRNKKVFQIIGLYQIDDLLRRIPGFHKCHYRLLMFRILRVERPGLQNLPGLCRNAVPSE